MSAPFEGSHSTIRVASTITRHTFLGPNARTNWLKARRTVITATDWAGILGLAATGAQEPQKTPFSIWAEKVGGRMEVAPETREDDEPTEAMTWGNVLEAPVAEEVGRRIGRHLVDHGRYTLFVNTVGPFPMGVTLDREISDTVPMAGSVGANNPVGIEYESTTPDPRGPGLLEIKTVGAFADPEAEWKEDGPVRHIVQVQAGLAALDWKWGILAGLNGSPAFHLRMHEHARDDAFIAWAGDRIARFWGYVTSRTPPPVDGSETTAKALARFYDRDAGTTIELPERCALFAEQLRDAKARIKAAKRDAQSAKNEIVAAMGDARIGLLGEAGGGFRLPRVEPSDTNCKKCGFVVVERKPYRRLTGFAGEEGEADGD